MKIRYFIGLLLAFINFGVVSSQEHEEVRAYFSRLNVDNEPVAIIDFTKSGVVLARDIESQIKTDLCEDPTFFGKTLIEDEAITYPVYFSNNCIETHPIRDEILPITINTVNQILFNEELISPYKSLTNKVLEEITVMMQEDEQNRILFTLYWQKECNPDVIKQRLFQVLNGIKMYADMTSMNMFQRPVNELDDDEFKMLKERFFGHIGLRGHIPPPPPPPPPPPIKNKN